MLKHCQNALRWHDHSSRERRQLGQHTVKYQYDIADADEVIEWKAESLLTDARTEYGVGQLYKNSTINEDNNQSIEYTNKLGQTILKKNMVEVISNDTIWAETYYIYDKYGNLTMVLPPEAINRLDQDFFDSGKDQYDRQDFLDVWAFQYTYDGRNRMIEKKVPGAKPVYMVYDKWDRLVLTQDGNQRLSNEWLFTRYDIHNRPVMTGIMSSTDSESTIRAAVASEADRYETFDETGTHQYTEVTYPSPNLVDRHLTVTYYDNYAFDDHASWSSLGLGFSDPESQLTQNTALKGQVTGTMTLVGDLSWIYSISYYDDKYRMIQARSTNHLGGTDAVTNYYDFIGQVDKTIGSHSDGVTTTTTTRRFVYDHIGRLLETWHQINSEDEVLIASNGYNELGELIEKDLHDEAQTIQYRYNIRGWLTSMNDPNLDSSTDYNSDLFGMKLHYNIANVSLGSKAMYSGNISAMEWSDFASMGLNTRAYAFTYDSLNRLKSADHFDGGSSTKFDVSGIGYDLNGNILALTRNGSSGAIDILDYEYEPDYANGKGGNQLRYVADTSSDAEGFDDGSSENTLINPDYTYDDNGNMTSDDNKGIISITYNHLNLPKKVVMSPGGISGEDNRIEYLYDATGIKMRQTVYEDGSIAKTTDYVGEFIYEDSELQLIQHEEGRIVPLTGGGFDYQYHLKDHLGNVRITFSSTPEDYVTIQDMESVDDAGTEPETPTYFVNIPYRQDGNINTTVGGDEVATLGAGSVGVMSLVRVKKNDQMSFSVYANYLADPSSSDFVSVTSALIFNGYNTGASGSGLESLPSAASTSIGDGVSAMSSGGGAKSSSGTTPKAYLNYIYFDKTMGYHSSGFSQISSAARGVGVNELVTLDAGTLDVDGYILVYLSNENDEAVDVNFDDLAINHTIVNDIISSQDYYPFGLTFNESVRVASKEQRFKFNGGTELIDELGLYMTRHRFYDGSLGRFIGIDALADMFPSISPMTYSYNNPIMFFDPTGLNGEKPCPDGVDCDGATMLDEVVVTAKRPKQRVNYDIWLTSRNPIKRAVARRKKNNDTDFMRNVVHNKTIHYSHGDYLTEISRDDNAGRIWQGIAARGIGGTMGAMFGAPALFGAGSIGSRVASGSIDVVSQVSIAYISNGGNLSNAVGSINLTSVGMSVMNPTANIRNVIVNSAIASSFDYRVSGQSNTILNGKSAQSVYASMALSGGTYGILKGVGAIGTAGVNNALSRMNSHWEAGFRAGGSVMNREASIIGVSFMLQTTGANSGVGTAVVNSIADQ